MGIRGLPVALVLVGSCACAWVGVPVLEVMVGKMPWSDCRSWAVDCCVGGADGGTGTAAGGVEFAGGKLERRPDFFRAAMRSALFRAGVDAAWFWMVFSCA